MNSLEYIGFVAGILVMASVLPQVIKSWRTRSTHDVALSWSIINLLGQAAWVWYGIGIGSHPLAIMSGITLLMNVCMITLKLRFG